MDERVLVDTSVWKAVADREPRAVGALQALRGRQSVLGTLTLAELQSLKARGRLTPQELDGIVLQSRLEEVQAADCLAGGDLHGHLRRVGRSKASIVDCVSYALARRLQVPFLTLDHDLADLPGVEGPSKPGKKT